MSAATTRARIARLKLVRDGINAELVALENALLMWGDDAPVEAGRTPGRPRLQPEFVYSEAEACAAHTLYARGERTAWVVDGERQYQRESKRRSREGRVAS